MSRHETERASSGRHPAEGQMPPFAHQEGKLLIAVGVSLLPLPLVVQFAGDLIEQFPWVRRGTQIAQLLLFFGALYFWGQHRSAAWRRSPWAQDLLWLLTILVGVLPLAMMLVAVMGGPDASGESLGRLFLRMGGYWLPVVFVVTLGGGALVVPWMRYGHHAFFWSMAVLACTYLAVPVPWRYFAANAGCCLAIIGAGCVLLWQRRRQVGDAA